MEQGAARADLGRMRLAGDVEGLCRVLRSGEFPMARQAAALLGDIGGPTAADALLDCLERPDSYPRYLHLRALASLGKLRERRAVPLLLRLLHDGRLENHGQEEAVFRALAAIGGPEVVSELIGRLAEPRPSKLVVDAVAALRPPEAVPALLAALWTLLPGDEVHAVRALGAMRDPRTGAALLFLVASEGTSAELRRAAVRALTELPEESWPPPAGWTPEIMLRRALRDPDAATARPAAELLSRTKTGRDELRGHLRDASPGRRAPYRAPSCSGVTVCALIQDRPELFGEAHDYRDVPALVKLLDEANPTLRRAAASALGAVGGTAAGGALLAALGDERIGEAVARAMTRLPEPPVQELFALLSGGGDAAQRGCVARALGLLGCTEAAPALLAALDDTGTPGLRTAAVDALAALRHRPAAERLAALAGDEEQPGTLRARAVRALGLIGARESLPVVLAAVRDPSEPVRLQAVRALGEFPVTETAGAAEAAEALGVVAALDVNLDVARAAVEALGRVGAPAGPVLVSLARPLRGDVADELIAALTHCPGAEAVAGLCQLTGAILPEDAHVAVAEALGVRRAPESAGPLAALLADDRRYSSRDAAVRALAELGTEEADEYVLAYCRRTGHDGEAQRAALTVIADRQEIEYAQASGRLQSPPCP
ncbi:HEAT repeat domain-containing protein [Streptomyces sp. BA2]|uniref:HEAT repeat domain-containing protein n=1 Tax=Streptomyces sp. BA2 TaxID=436595 RepID=UPI001328487A|nr:HEAT repeat domain-containing protein [Streptomyces sp. BA2]